MQVNQSFGPQYVDNVKNSRQQTNENRLTQNERRQIQNERRSTINERRPTSKQQYTSLHQQYKSPSRTSYQSRYPASYGIQKANSSNNNYVNNNGSIKVSISPPKQTYNMSKSPGEGMNNIKGYNNNTSKYDDNRYNSRYDGMGYTSPNRPSFMPSPYNYNNNYSSLNHQFSSPSNNNNYHNNSYSINNPTRSYQQQQIKSKSLIQLQKLVSQLKLSLNQSLSTQQSLQQQLNKQQRKSYQFSQIKRKLEQQLSRMQFQLQKITNNDLLNQKQLLIKYQNQVKQNQRLNSQLNQVRQQLKKLRKQHRQVMTQSNQYKQQNQLLKSDNIQLINKLQQLTLQFNQISQQYQYQYNNSNRQSGVNVNIQRQQQQNASFAYNNIKSQQSIIKSQQSINNYVGSNNNNNFGNNNNNQIPSIANINNINTTRTNNYDSHMYNNNDSHMYNNNANPNIINYTKSKPQSPIYSPNNQPQQINYDYQNSKLIDDYNKLMLQNESMKKLYQQFYTSSQNHIQSPHGQYQQINQEDQQLQETKQQNFYNHHNNNVNNKYTHQQYQYQYQPSSQSPQQSQRLRTFQKTHLYQQVSSLRQQLIQSLIQNYYTLAVSNAQQQKSNVLIIFIKTINKNLPTIQKMVINYLQARDIMKKQLQNNHIKQTDEPQTKYQQQAQQLWLNTKQKLKVQLKAQSLPNNNTLNKYQIITLNINAYYLALFRLLTLIHKYQNNTIHPDSNTLIKIKHQSLKYIHKIHQQTIKLNQKSSNK